MHFTKYTDIKHKKSDKIQKAQDRIQDGIQSAREKKKDLITKFAKSCTN